MEVKTVNGKKIESFNLLELIKSLIETEDFVNWGWGCEAIRYVGEQIELAKKEIYQSIEEGVMFDSYAVEFVKKKIEKWFGDNTDNQTYYEQMIRARVKNRSSKLRDIHIEKDLKKKFKWFDSNDCDES